MSVSWDDVMNGKELTQDEVLELHKKAMGMINGANATLGIARKQLEILRGICKHPRKEKYRCPDCGSDWSPD